MKKFINRFIRPVVLAIAILIALVYVFDYDYLFRGIRKTYLRGDVTASITDEKLFESNKIVSGGPKPWVRDSLFNQTKIPPKLRKNLEETNTASFLIVKDGKLLHEEYWPGYSASTKTNSFSMAKAMTVLLLGKAVEEGTIKSIHEKYSEFYANYANVEHGKFLTLYDLAAMESGLNWEENYRNPFTPNAKLYYGSSLAEASFLKGFKAKPGTRFEYQSGTTQLLGFAVRKAVKMPLASYLSQKFWQPMGMEAAAAWATDDYMMEKAFCCVYGISKDFAKFGQLFLNDGKMYGKQIINARFIEEMRTSTALSNGIYGMGLWINNDVSAKHYFMLGLQGQYVIVVPQYQMVIVRTGSYMKQPKNDRGRPDQVKFIVEEVVNNYLNH